MGLLNQEGSIDLLDYKKEVDEFFDLCPDGEIDWDTPYVIMPRSPTGEPCSNSCDTIFMRLIEMGFLLKEQDTKGVECYSVFSPEGENLNPSYEGNKVYFARLRDAEKWTDAIFRSKIKTDPRYLINHPP